MGKVYEDDYRIPGFAGDRYGRAGLANMMNVMLEISERQLETLHAGMDAINEFQAGWVITQYHMDIQRMPRIEEPLRVGTEATTYNKFFTYRDYWIDDAQGQRLVTVNSNWIIMDLRTRKIVDVIPELVERVGAVSDRKIKRFPRLKRSPPQMAKKIFMSAILILTVTDTSTMLITWNGWKIVLAMIF